MTEGPPPGPVNASFGKSRNLLCEIQMETTPTEIPKGAKYGNFYFLFIFFYSV